MFPVCTPRPARRVRRSAAPRPRAEDDSGPAAAAALDQPAHFPGRVQLDRGGP